MSLLTNKTEFKTFMNTISKMYHLAELSFQNTIPSPATGIWTAPYNITTKLKDAKNQAVGGSKFHDNDYITSPTITVSAGSTLISFSSDISLDTGEIIVSYSNSNVIGTISSGYTGTGVGTTSYYSTGSFGNSVSNDSFYVSHPLQPSYYDAASTLINTMRSTEKNLNSIPVSSFSSLTAALNSFYTTITGFGLKSYWDPLRSGVTTGTGMTQLDWDASFRTLWSATRNEELVNRQSYWAVTSGSGGIFISTTSPDFNVSYNVAQAIRLKITAVSSVTLSSYTLITSGSGTFTRTLTTPVVFGAGTTTYTLENGSVNYFGASAIGATGSSGSVIEVYNL